MNNQSVKADAGKPKLSLVPSQIIWDIAEVREYGNKKYPEGGKDNWKNVEMERYVDALYRHFLAFVENPWSKDSESGIFHYKHMACNIAFICAMMEDCKIPEPLVKDMDIPKGEYLITERVKNYCYICGKEIKTNETRLVTLKELLNSIPFIDELNILYDYDNKLVCSDCETKFMNNFRKEE